MPWLRDGNTVVIFGDSLTENPNGYTKDLGAALSRRGITMIRAGRGGDKTPAALTRLQADVIDRKPDAVCVFLGANDAAVGRGCWADEPTVPPAAYESNLIWIMHLCKLAGIAKFSVIPPLFRFEGPAFEDFGESMLPYRQAARSAAEAMSACFVPADIAFADEWARHPGHTGLLLTTDGVHLTAEGSRILMERILAAWGLAAD
jgi:lysophospholipase L1-like esterase